MAMSLGQSPELGGFDGLALLLHSQLFRQDQITFPRFKGAAH